MKKTIRSLLVLLVMALLTAALVMGATAEAELPQQCAHCGKEVTWLPLSEVSETTIPAGHYYVDAETVKVTNKTVAKSTQVCIYMNGNTVEADGVDRVFYVSGTLSVMGEGTVKGYGRSSSMSSTSDRYGGTVHITSNGTFHLYDATVTSEKLETSKASNGGNINVMGSFYMHSGAITGGYASNAGGSIFVSASGEFHMSGGSITNGTCSTGKGVCAQGKVLLSGDAHISHLYLWDKNEKGFDTLLTVQGVYTGTTYFQLRKGSSTLTPTADLVVGTSDGANLRRANLDFYGSGLYAKVSGTQLVLTTEDPSIVKQACRYCGETVNWNPLTEENASDSSIDTGHYYLDFDEGADIWSSKTISSTVCLDLNGMSLTGEGRVFAVQQNGILNIQGNGTVTGRGRPTTESTTDRVGGTVLVAGGGTLNLYSGTLTFEKVDGQNASNGGVVCTYGTFNMYGGAVKDGAVSNAGANIFVTPAGAFKMCSGTVSGGTGSSSVYCQGSLLLSGDAAVNKVYMTYKSGGPSIDAMLTVEGDYIGSALLEINGMTFSEGTVVGISKDADLRHASISIEDCSLLVTAEGNTLKLTETLPAVTKEAYCSVCEKNAVWTCLMESHSALATLETGHYYLEFGTNSGLWDSKTISGKVCLDLGGMILTGRTRAFLVESGSVLNLMGEGTIVGRGKSSSLELSERTAGTILVEKGATLNQYGGKLTYEKVSNQSAGNGGILNVAGTYNLHNGSVENGQSAWVGGNIFVTTTGQLNLYGGTVTGGTASQAGNSIACRGHVLLSGDACVNELYLYPNTADGGPALSEMLTVQNKYSGSVKLRISGISGGMDVGTAVNADLSDATVTTNSSSISGLSVHGNDLILLGNNAAVIMDGTTVVGVYTDLPAAIEACTADTQRIVLFADVTADLTLNKDIYVDLNGFHITGSITGTGTLYCMDAHTDDFTVADGVYGTVPAGDHVQAVPMDAACTNDRYLMIINDDKASFHRVNLQINGVSLRTSVVGLYYTCSFAGDELVADKVTSFGMIVSVEGDPLTVGDSGVVGRTCIDKALFGANTSSTSTMVKGIMKTTNLESTNATNATLRIYGRTYVQFDNTILYGDCVARSLQEQICGSESMYGIERMWDGLSTIQKRNIMDLYTKYQGVMDDWDIPTISGAAAVRDDAAEDILLERRQQVVAKMRQMGDLHWRATEDVKYRISSTGRWVEFKAGRVYRGIPYAHARSDENTFLEFAGEPDEKGIYPISGLTATHMGNGSIYARIGNDCSGSVNFSWSSVGADITGTQSSRYMIEANGYLKVGNYEYTPTDDGRIGISKEIVAANGKEVMFEAYAKVQPGDGLDTTTASGGHVILVVDKHVVYNADGSINGELSYIHTLEQTPGPVSITVQKHSYNAELDEIVYDIYIEKNMTFNQVYSSGYLPITVNVLVDPTPVAEPSVTDTLSPEEYTYENLFKGELICSRMISSVTITVTDGNGQVFSYTGSGIRASIRTYNMQNFLTEDPAVMRGSLDLDKLVSGNNYHCTVVVQLASGDTITVRDFDFTANDTDISTPESTQTPDSTEPEEDEEIPEDTTVS